MHFDEVLSECIHPCSKKRRRAQFSIRAELTRLSVCALRMCVRARASDVCVENFSHSTRLFRQQCRASFMLALCLRAVLISSPDTWDWTRMHALVIMHRRTLYENVNSAKIKAAFYTTDIDILRVASMHRIVIHCIYILIHIDESLHPYWLHIWFRAGYRWWRSPQRSTQLEFPKGNRTLFLHVVAFAMNILLTGISHAYY